MIMEEDEVKSGAEITFATHNYTCEHTCSIWDQFEKYNSSMGMLRGIWMQENPLIWMQENPIKIRGVYKGVYSHK